MKFLIGTKQAMTRVFQDDGTAVPVTVIHAGPCTVTQVKTKEKDGTNAVQLGFGEKQKQAKAQKGHLKDLPLHRTLREFRVENPGEFQRGTTVDVSQFSVGDRVLVSGTSKGRGFAGAMKRHGFHGTKATHGNKDQARMPGSIGATDPAHVFKGTRMAGRMGNSKVTTRGLRVIAVDVERNELKISGAVPGARNSLVTIIADV